jgi:hypothetical protein
MPAFRKLSGCTKIDRQFDRDKKDIDQYNLYNEQKLKV